MDASGSKTYDWTRKTICMKSGLIKRVWSNMRLLSQFILPRLMTPLKTLQIKVSKTVTCHEKTLPFHRASTFILNENWYPMEITITIEQKVINPEKSFFTFLSMLAGNSIKRVCKRKKKHYCIFLLICSIISILPALKDFMFVSLENDPQTIVKRKRKKEKIYSLQHLFFLGH